MGEPVPPATEGWLERWYNGSSWVYETVVVWWFAGDSAQQWARKDSKTFVVADFPAKELGRQIAIAHELDCVRTVPNSQFAPVCDPRIHGV